MKAIKLLGMLMLALALPVLVSCSEEEEEPLESAIVGKWYSYKAYVSSFGGKKTVSVTQNGEYAGFYLEFIASPNGTGVLRGWKTDEDGQLMYWGEETKCVYTINDDEITLIDPSGEKMVAKYYPKDKDIVLTILSKDELGYLITTNLYFKK